MSEKNEQDLSPAATGMLTAFVRERQIEERPSDSARCPYCDGTALQFHGTEQTLLGWSGKGDDPNHKWEHWRCGCGRAFVRESKNGHVWYTSDRADAIVLRGLPDCYESYTYHCAKCDGPVRRRHLDLTGREAKWLSYKGGVPQFVTELNCKACGAGMVIDDRDRGYPRPVAPVAGGEKP